MQSAMMTEDIVDMENNNDAVREATSTPVFVRKSEEANASAVSAQREMQNKKQSQTQINGNQVSDKAERRGTIFRLVERMNPNRKSVLKPRSHYKRGTIFLRHLEAQKIAKGESKVDHKFIETMKKHYQSSHLSAETMIGISIFQSGENPTDDPFRVSNMPLEIQIGFRRKVFSLFSLQLLAVVAIVSISTYLLKDNIKPETGHFISYIWHIVAMFGCMIVALFLLHLKRFNFPINFILLGLFTATQSVFLFALDTYIGNSVSIFVFSFVFLVMLLHGFVCTTTRKDDTGNYKLLGYVPSVLISYAVVFLVSIGIFLGILYDSKAMAYTSMTWTQYLLCCASILLLSIWFAYDASCLSEVSE